MKHNEQVKHYIWELVLNEPRTWLIGSRNSRFKVILRPKLKVVYKGPTLLRVFRW